MNNMNGYMPVKVFTGKGCVSAHASALMLGRKALIVTGKHSAVTCGALADVISALGKIPYVLFDDIGPNPLLTDCMRAAELGQKEGCDFIIGIGGGSPLDAAKCIAVFAANPGLTQEGLYSLSWPNPPLPIAVIGTTAGTGSEVTKVSVITTPEGRKKSFHHEAVYPKAAFGDPAYLAYMPEAVAASTAIDALAHATESFFSRHANELSQLYAVRAVQLIVPELKKLAADDYNCFTDEDRLNSYHASIYAGLAINLTGTCLPHTMGYLMTEQHDVPHGFACALFLPAFLEINQEAVPELYERFFRETGSDRDALMSLIRTLLADVHVTISEEEIQREHNRWIQNASILKGWGDIPPEMCDGILREIDETYH